MIEILNQLVGLEIHRTTGTHQILASIPSRDARFGKRYGQGETEAHAVADLILNLIR
jgi:hypothetical protein